MVDQEMLQAMRTLLREEVRGVVADELQEVKSVQASMQTELKEVKSTLEGIRDIVVEIPEIVGKHFDRLEQKVDTVESNLTDTINEMKIATMENSYDIQVMKPKAMRMQA